MFGFFRVTLHQTVFLGFLCTQLAVKIPHAPILSAVPAFCLLPLLHATSRFFVIVEIVQKLRSVWWPLYVAIVTG